MFSWFKKKREGNAQTSVIQPIYHWSDDEIPRYPPFMKGLPVVPPEKLIETQSDLINRIANTAIATPEVFERYYLPAIRRFASYAHLLPASQSHHHRGAGGLLRHSIEVGLWALQSADKVLLDGPKTPLQRREMEPRWQLAVFLAALCHDAGKPVTDLVVTNRDRTAVWKPIKEDLFTWASKNHVQAYFLAWREGRAKQHTALSNLIGDRIIGAETLEWIEEGGTELVVWLAESLTSNPGPTNPIYDLVIKADQTSVERDLKTLGVAMAGYDLGVPVERHLTDIMRRLIKEGVWLVNEPGARVWNIEGNLYLVWPAAGEDIVKQVCQDGIPGIPRTPDGILDMLLERQIAFVREDAAPGDRLWKIAPSVLAEKNPDIALSAIRLRDEAMVSTIPIQPIAGRIVSDASASQRAESAPSTSPEADEDCVIAQKPTVAEEGQPNGKGAGVEEGTHQPRPPAKEKSARSTPTVRVRADQKTAIESVARPADESPRQDATPIVLTGVAGEALKALAQDIKAGSKQWGRDVIIDQDQYLLIRWPDSFSGYGLTAKAIMDELMANEWLWIDPMNPLKRAVDVEMDGEAVKALRLVPELTPVFVMEAGGGPDSVAATPKTSINQPRALEDNAKTNTSNTEASRGIKPNNRQTITAQKEPTEAQGKAGHKKSEAPALPTEPAMPASSSPDAPSLKQVIEVLADIANGKPADHDGWYTVPKYHAMLQFKAKKLKVSPGQLDKLANAHADKLVILNSKIRFKL